MYRIFYGPVFSEAASLAEAQDIALTEARALTRACGFPVEAKVFRLGHVEVDVAGQRVYRHFPVGKAVGRIEHSNAFVSWVPEKIRVAA